MIILNKKLIKLYIDKLNIDNIKTFLNNNNIYLTNNENIILYNEIKKNWEKVLNNDESSIFELSNKIDKDNYEKLYKLYLFYKEKYKNFFN